MSIRTFRVLPAFLCLALLMSSCGFGVWVSSVFGASLNLQVKVSANANQNNPVQMDALLVYDEALLKELLKMSAKDWFAGRNEMRNNYPDHTGFESWQWEWIPGQEVPKQSLPLRASAIACLIFANYYTPGPHRVRIDPHRDATIFLQEQDFSIEPQ